MLTKIHSGGGCLSFHVSNLSEITSTDFSRGARGYTREGAETEMGIYLCILPNSCEDLASLKIWPSLGKVFARGYINAQNSQSDLHNTF